MDAITGITVAMLVVAVLSIIFMIISLKAKRPLRWYERGTMVVFVYLWLGHLFTSIGLPLMVGFVIAAAVVFVALRTHYRRLRRSIRSTD